MMPPLAQRTCKPCKPGTPALTPGEVQSYRKELKTPWQSIDSAKIKQGFTFKDFGKALAFVNKIAEIAERENHHPDIFLSYGKAVVELSTHSIGGLSENDFILAAKIEALI